MRIFRDIRHLAVLRGLTELETIAPQICSIKKVHDLEMKVGAKTLRDLNPLMSEFYSSLRRNRYDTDNHDQCLIILSKILQEILHNAVQYPLVHLIFIQNLRNICHQEQLFLLKDQNKNNKWKTLNDSYSDIERKYVIHDEEIKKSQGLEKDFETLMKDTHEKTKAGELSPMPIREFKQSEIPVTLDEVIQQARSMADLSEDKDYYLREISRITGHLTYNQVKKITELQEIISLIESPSLNTGLSKTTHSSNRNNLLLSSTSSKNSTQPSTSSASSSSSSSVMIWKPSNSQPTYGSTNSSVSSSIQGVLGVL